MRAALYVRSSKDRHDVSLDAQRRELKALAKARSSRVVEEFADAVESGKDEDRPGFQRLIAAVRNPRRGWDTLLVLDTSRIARRRHLALMFERECERAGVRLVYKSLPETDPVTEMLLKSILQAMDEWHSLTSRAKGLTGMRENVRQGFRAGGRAPLGYRLEAVETGAMRDGQPVRKSRLALGPDAAAVQAYLRARAEGQPRAAVALPGVSKSSLVGIEWNALTYAGHTVWNVHAEAGSGRKRRPRSEWVVQRDTHEALITDDEADAIIARLEGWSAKRRRHREAGYLLAGLLVTPDGKSFAGDRGSYRVRGRYVRAAELDQAVAASVLRDMQSPAFVRAVTAAARGASGADTTGPAREALAATEGRLERLLALVEQTDTPGPLLRQMEAVEAERLRLGEVLAAAEAEAAERAAMSRITEIEVRRILVERAEAIATADPDEARVGLQSVLSRVVLDGDEVTIEYRFSRPGRGRKADTLELEHRPGPGLRSAPRGDATLNRPAIALARRHRVG